MSQGSRYAFLALALVCWSWGCRKPERSQDSERFAGPVVRSSPRTIVVLGSSTAAGVGPREPDDAYVARYQAFLVRRFPDFSLVNLAVSGYTTYDVQPTGFTPPPARPAPSPGHNISAALERHPAAILLNLPSNDAALSIPASEQLDNFARVARLATDAGAALWVTTTQPRSLTEAQVALQRQVREEILGRYSPRALDFWTPFASPNGSIQSKFDSGDGIHLNAAGHSILLTLLVNAKLPENVLQASR